MKDEAAASRQNTGWVIVSALLRGGTVDLGLTSIEQLILLHISRFAWNGKAEAWPSEATLAKEAGVSPRSVRRVKQKLSRTMVNDRPLLSWETVRSGNGKPEKCIYNLEALHEWATAFIKDTESVYTDRESAAYGQSVLPIRTQCPKKILKEDTKRSTYSAPQKRARNPDIKTFIDFAYETHLAATEKKLHVDGGKDGATVKRMLATYSLEDLQRYWKQYLEDDDPFVVENGYSIGRFKSMISRYVTGSPGGKLQRCAACNGTGEFSGETCPRCGGVGRS
ncbi:MAG: helix-turn-helix domain-containing protein [Deltaproteobacteria bacterium]|nr:helix-turn-helix domain-containing protein [Deltaproteobacteria bacterium]